MNNSSNEVVVINRLQNNLNIPLKKPGLHKKFGFFCVRQRCSWIWFSFGVKFEPRALETKNVTAVRQENIIRCSWTLLVQQREQLLVSVVASSGLSVLNFVVNFDSGKPLYIEIFERERRLAADKVIGTLTPAVEYKSSTSEAVYSVVTKYEGYYFWGGSNGCFLFFW